MQNFKKYLAEFIGTLALVLFGCGVASLTGCEQWGGYIATALAFGFTIVAMAYSIGNVSGCHVNPAVSLAMLLTGQLDGKDFAGYVIAQFLGATVGAALLQLIFAGAGVTDATGALGSNGLAGLNGSIWAGRAYHSRCSGFQSRPRSFRRPHHRPFPYSGTPSGHRPYRNQR